MIVSPGITEQALGPKGLRCISEDICIATEFGVTCVIDFGGC